MRNCFVPSNSALIFFMIENTYHKGRIFLWTKFCSIKNFLVLCRRNFAEAEREILQDAKRADNFGENVLCTFDQTLLTRGSALQTPKGDEENHC